MLPRRLLVLAVTGLLVGCSAQVRPRTPAALSPLPVRPYAGHGLQDVTAELDNTGVLIARAEAEFAAGQAELKVGHAAAARTRFDAALDVLMRAPGGARSQPRLTTEFDKLLDQISAIEVVQLRAGDGFAEAQTEPAAIDDLLAIATFDHPPMPNATTEEIVKADLARTPHDLPIQVNDKVLSYVQLFQGNLHSFVEDGLKRGARYLPMIQDVLKSQGLPTDLAYVPLVESAFKPTALSRASAKGLWQFETSTAKEAGLRENWFLDERSDPEKATRAAADYLKGLCDMFDGNWDLALASYNAGMGRVQRAMRVAGTDDYWTLTQSSRYLPRETREYVPMVLAAMIIGRDPEQYGFDIGPVEPFAYDTVRVPDALNLGVVAEWLGLPVEKIQALNPELRRGMTPVGAHELKIPVGTAGIVKAHLADAPHSIFASAGFLRHTVRRGESLWSIARKYGTTTTNLSSANSLGKRSVLKVGMTLMVPVAPSAVLASRTVSQSSRGLASGSGGRATYRVRTGDTLWSIADHFDMSVNSLKRLNRLSTDRIAAGARLTVVH